MTRSCPLERALLVQPGPDPVRLALVPESTRLSILEHALAEILERLDGLPASRDTEALRVLARQYESEVASWQREPPDEAARSKLLKRVLDLNVLVIRTGGAKRS